ncbi:unnamed protein product, partial [Musa textilis]
LPRCHRRGHPRACRHPHPQERRRRDPPRPRGWGNALGNGLGPPGIHTHKWPSPTELAQARNPGMLCNLRSASYF